MCGYEYDLVYDLDKGLDQLKVIQNLTGAQLNPRYIFFNKAPL